VTRLKQWVTRGTRHLHELVKAVIEAIAAANSQLKDQELFFHVGLAWNIQAFGDILHLPTESVTYGPCPSRFLSIAIVVGKQSQAKYKADPTTTLLHDPTHFLCKWTKIAYLLPCAKQD
jgi:hypothetical protein